MTSNFNLLASKLQRNLTKLIGSLLVLVLALQSSALVGGIVIASPVFAVSSSSMSKQVSGKVDELKGKTERSIGKVQSDLEYKVGSVKEKVKDDLTEAKIAVDSNNARIANTADKASGKIKDFFGK